METKTVHTNNIQTAGYIAMKTSIMPVVIPIRGENVFCFVNDKNIQEAVIKYKELTVNQEITKQLVEDKDINKFNLIIGKLKKTWLFQKRYGNIID